MFTKYKSLILLSAIFLLNAGMTLLFYFNSKKLPGDVMILLVILSLMNLLLIGAIYIYYFYPMHSLSMIADKIAKGEYNLKINIKNNTELRSIAHSVEEITESLRKAQTKIIRMDRMSAVGTLAGSIAHEISNPLTGVLGLTQIILLKIGSNDPNRQTLESIQKAARQCKDILRSLTDFSRSQEYDFNEVHVDNIIQFALNLCETEFTASSIDVRWKKNPSIPAIWASAQHLQQVVLNLCINSIHAMPNGGTYTIENKIEKLPNSKNIVKGTSQKLMPFLIMTFRDTGTGISSENLPYLFEPFFSTKERGKGSGLGLYVSNDIIEKHRGSIIAESDGYGYGAQFKIVLPVSNDIEKQKDDHGK